MSWTRTQGRKRNDPREGVVQVNNIDTELAIVRAQLALLVPMVIDAFEMLCAMGNAEAAYHLLTKELPT